MIFRQLGRLGEKVVREVRVDLGISHMVQIRADRDSAREVTRVRRLVRVIVEGVAKLMEVSREVVLRRGNAIIAASKDIPSGNAITPPCATSAEAQGTRALIARKRARVRGGMVVESMDSLMVVRRRRVYP